MLVPSWGDFKGTANMLQTNHIIKGISKSEWDTMVQKNRF